MVTEIYGFIFISVAITVIIVGRAKHIRVYLFRTFYQPSFGINIGLNDFITVHCTSNKRSCLSKLIFLCQVRD